MIEVEIKGPVAKREYEKMKSTLMETGENILCEKRATIVFVGEHSHSFTDITITSGVDSKIILRDHKAKTETVLALASNQFSESVEFCAKLGYVKGVVSVREYLCANYGGAYFSDRKSTRLNSSH